MKTKLQNLRDLAGVLVGTKKQAVIDVTEESKPVLEAFLSDVYRKYSSRVRPHRRPTKLKRRRRSGPQRALHT